MIVILNLKNNIMTNSRTDYLIEKLGGRRTTEEERIDMLSNQKLFERRIPIIGPVCSQGHNDIELNETLIDHFFNFFGTDLLFTEKNSDKLFSKLNQFMKHSNLKINISEDNTLKSTVGYINDKTIYISHPHNAGDKEIIYVILHELSHYITNKSSDNKLLRFVNTPLTIHPDINNITHLKKELKYMLSPAELSNWAFTLSLALFEEKYNSASDFYKIVKFQIEDIDSFKNTPDLFNTKIYTSIKIDDLKVLYYLIIYIHQLKILKLERRQRIKYNHKLMSLIKILDKYVKRLNRLFK